MADPIEIAAEIEIAAAPADVAGVMFDPQREPEWMQAVTGVELVDPALAPGARVRRTGRVMGRDLSWTTAVDRVHFPHLLTLRITEGPISGAIRYDIQRSAGGSHVRILNVGDAGALGSIPAALVAAPLRAAMQEDLKRLKALIEEHR